jgi:isoquinoline 1-oxidoreductase beta subunit
MVYAVVAHCPYFRGDLLRFDAAKAKAIPGALEVFDIPTDPHSANKSTKHFGILPDGSIVAIRSDSFASR